MTRSSRQLSIFVHSASGCLTDHVPHGDGLKCFGILNGLAERGHKIFAYTTHADIRRCHPRLHVHVGAQRTPAHSFAPWEHSWRAERWMRRLVRERPIDIVWRMDPYACPYPPPTGGRPLVVGPMCPAWPANTPTAARFGQPRFGVGLQWLAQPALARGWDRTLRRAALLFSHPAGYTAELAARYPRARSVHSPLIVDLPERVPPRSQSGRPLRLLFVANLVPNKQPLVFCDVVRLLRETGVAATGTIMGDGILRPEVERFIAQHALQSAVAVLGRRPDSEKYRLMREADFFVSTSVGEPYGRSIAEAMASGTPCVSHRSGGPADFVENAVDGLLVGEFDAAEFARAIADVWSTPPKWERLSAAACRKASAWTTDVVLAEIEEELDRLCPQPSLRFTYSAG